jgi:hypothetical protein
MPVPDKFVILPKHKIVVFIGHTLLLSGSPEIHKGEGNMRFTSISTLALTAGERGGNIRRRSVLASAALASAAFVVLSTHANAANEKFSAVLSGFEEVGAFPSLKTPPGATEPETISGPTGAIFSTGNGTLELILDKTVPSISYTLTYSSLTSTVQQAHIHFGKRHVPGGIMVFFCTNLTTPPTTPVPPLCPNPPTAPLTVTGTWIPTSVVAVPGQNIVAGDFNALIAALESNTAYGNIHTANFPSGEIRGQIRLNQGNEGNQGNQGNQGNH